MNGLAVIWSIAALATGGVILRPWKLPEAVWAVAGAALLVAIGSLPLRTALDAVVKGTDVYLFLTGMMLLSELARAEGLFDWLATRAAALAQGSAAQLFNLIYVIGIVVTIILSNDATAVVLTPAVAAAARAAGLSNPLPYVLVCAFIANAASFVLPISNPANLVFYAGHVPPLLEWLPRYSVPSLLSIAATYLALRFTQRHGLQQPVATKVSSPRLSASAGMTAAGIFGTAALLMAVSAFELPLGLPTCLAGVATAALVCLRKREICWTVLKHVSWGVLPLVAGLLVLVEAVERTGVIRMLAELLQLQVQRSAGVAVLAAGSLLGFCCNVLNNLPAGLMAAGVSASAKPPPDISGAMLIGVDLGPNLSVTGSLATILWLAALRRDGITVGAWTFFKLGILIMPPALLLSIAGLIVVG